MNEFCYEVNLLETYDVPMMVRYSWFKISENEKKRYLDIMNLVSITRNISSYKIIKSISKFNKIKIKILLKEEPDIIFLTLAGSDIIEKIYHYSPTLDIK